MISVSRILLQSVEQKKTLDEMSRSCHLKMLITSTESQTNFKEADQNHDKEDQLKNMDEQKVSNGQVLMDLLIKSVQIALDHIHQTSVEQLVENVMGATKSDIIFECAQTTRKVGLISLKKKHFKCSCSSN